MAKTGTQRTTAWRAKLKVKRLRDEAAFDQVLGAMEVSPVRTADGWTVNIGLSKTCPEWAIFVDLAEGMRLTPTQLFGQLTRGAVKRYMAGECD